LAQKGQKDFYAIGFCWGVWAGFKFSVKFSGFRAFVGFHPSLGLCDFFSESQTDLIEKITCPAFLCPAQNDPPNVKEGGALIEILQRRFGKERVGTKEFPDQSHGWVVRGDMSQPNVRRDVQLALELAIHYFEKL
jgi:dienelactone hydrolase